MGGKALLGAFDFVSREVTLFAATGFLVLGLSDLCVDLIWIGRTLWRRSTVYRRHARATAETLGPPASPGLIAVFVPAWREDKVIGGMLRHALRTFDHDDYRLYVGCYPNDPDTIAAVREVGDARIRLVVGPVAGGTTKADCLNRLWKALTEDERAEGRRAKAIVLHDAEDVVHSADVAGQKCWPKIT